MATLGVRLAHYVKEERINVIVERLVVKEKLGN